MEASQSAAYVALEAIGASQLVDTLLDVTEVAIGHGAALDVADIVSLLSTQCIPQCEVAIKHSYWKVVPGEDRLHLLLHFVVDEGKLEVCPLLIDGMFLTCSSCTPRGWAQDVLRIPIEFEDVIEVLLVAFGVDGKGAPVVDAPALVSNAAQFRC